MSFISASELLNRITRRAREIVSLQESASQPTDPEIRAIIRFSPDQESSDSELEDPGHPPDCSSDSDNSDSEFILDPSPIPSRPVDSYPYQDKPSCVLFSTDGDHRVICSTCRDETTVSIHRPSGTCMRLHTHPLSQDCPLDGDTSDEESCTSVSTPPSSGIVLVVPPPPQPPFRTFRRLKPSQRELLDLIETTARVVGARRRVYAPKYLHAKRLRFE